MYLLKKIGLSLSMAIGVLLITASAVEADESAVYVIKGSETAVTVTQNGEEVFFGDIEEAFSFCSDKPFSHIVGEDVSVSSALTLPDGAYSIGGSWTLAAPLHIAEETALTLNNANVYLQSDGYFHVKGGSLTVSDSVITADKTAVRQDFSASSSFIFLSGSLSSSDFSVVATQGTVKVTGGVINSDAEAAVVSYGTVILSGEPVVSSAFVGIKLSEPPLLSADGVPFAGVISILSMKTYAVGDFAVAAYRAEKGAEERISYYDAGGVAVSLSYFEKSDYTDETDVLAVCLPYTLRVFADGELKETLIDFSFSPSDISTNTEKPGYTFLGWYQKGTNVPFLGTEERSLDVEAKYRLDAPTFSIFSSPFIYDGLTHDFTFSSLTHPLSEYGFFSFVWKKDSETIPASSGVIRIRDVMDSGSYTCEVTFTYGAESVTVTTPPVEVTVLPKTVAFPTSVFYVYDQEEHKASFPASADYILVSNMAGINAGFYPYTLALTDPDNTVWEDGTSKETTLYYEIKKAENRWLVALKAGVCYLGNEPEIEAKAAYGEVRFLFAAEGSFDFRYSFPTEAGVYLVKAAVAENGNYYGLESEALSFVLAPVTVVGLRACELPFRTEYTAFDIFDPDGLSVVATYADGSMKPVDNGDLSFRYRTGDAFAFGDTFVTATLDSVFVAIPVTVRKAVYNMAEISFSDTEKVFNGEWQTLSIDGSLGIGTESCPFCVSYVGGGIHAGTYEISAVFSTEDPNYEVPKPLSAVLTILPLPVDADWDATGLCYSGEVNLPKVRCIGLLGEELPYRLSGGGIDAGEYEATLTLLTGDYVLTNPRFSYSVLKAAFDLSRLCPSCVAVPYDGGEKSSVLTGVPAGLSVAGYVNAVGTDAGVYHASASFTFDTKNYESVGTFSWDWEILPADYDLSTFSFDLTPVVFDGEAHVPAILGTLPTGADGSVLSLAFEDSVTHAAEDVPLTVYFHTESLNYKTPEPTVVFFTVLPLPITVDWGETVFVYDGERHVPGATGIVPIVVSEGAIYAGEYTATATSADPDYAVENDRIGFTIKKAENGWLVPFSVGDFYADSEPVIGGIPKKGEMTVTYYTDAACLSAVTELTAGQYYAKAAVAELRNYEALESEAVPFSVFSVVAVSLSATLTKEDYFGGETLFDEDVILTLLFNSGKDRILSLSEVSVSYENADYLTVFDRTVGFTFGGLSCEAPIAVKKTVIALPEFSAEYSGETKSAEVAGDEPYEIVGEIFAVPAGEYALTLRLKDADNYAFEGTDDPTVTATFRVTPRKITVKIADVLLYRDGVYGETDFEIVSGTLADGDTLSLAFVYGETVTAIGHNPDYKIEVIDGRIIETSALSAAGKRKRTALLTVFGILSVLSAVCILYRKKNGNNAVTPTPDGFPAELPATFGNSQKVTGKRYSAAVVPGTVRLPSLRLEEIVKEILASVDKEHADELISDGFARHLLNRKKEKIVTFGKRKCILNLDTVNAHFENGSRVDINVLKAKGLLPYDCGYVKILARGTIGKQLYVYADDFSLQAVKMIALTGGIAVRVTTVSKKFSAQ